MLDIIEFLLLVFLGLDIVAFVKAYKSSPECIKSFSYKLPGGGFIARYKVGRKG